MIKKNMLMMSGIAAAIVVAAAAYGDIDHEKKQPVGNQEHHEHGVSPLIEEMVTLDNVFRKVVSAVAVGDGHRVHEALEKMQGTMEKTHEGVHHGTVVLKKNAGRLDEFVAQDKQFHAKLEELAKAARQNDKTGMLGLAKDLLDRCVRCHNDFRKE